MDAGQIISSVIGGVAVLFLGAIGRMILGIRTDFRRFMAEHLWLLATTMWTRDKVIIIMKAMNIEINDPPPNDLKQEN
jgi:hypothetical protein